MKPSCVQKHIKHDVRHNVRYKLFDERGGAFNKVTLYGMYLEKVEDYERIHKVTVIPIKVDTLRKNVSHWDWIERRGDGKAAYYIRIDEPRRVEFSDIYGAVMRRYRGIFNGKSS